MVLKLSQKQLTGNDYIERNTGVLYDPGSGSAPFPVTNGANYYILDESDFRLVQKIAPSDGGSEEYYVKQKWTVQFFTTELCTNYVS